jgi:hypothetical protein
MSRSATRARRRRAHIEGQIEALLGRAEHATTAEDRVVAMGELVDLLKRVADSDLRLWSFARLFGPDGDGGCGEEADGTRALIAQLVAPNLVGTPHDAWPRRCYSSSRADR